MKPVLLMILDGFGYRTEEKGNAIVQAKTPNFDWLWQKYPHTKLMASGTAVGLPDGQMGNSEVGHMNIGAGRVLYQPLERINQSIADGTFYQNEELLKVIEHTKKNQSKLHIMGLISDGGVHSHIDHLMALLDLCKKEKVNKLYLHLFTDGRDVSPTSAMKYISKVQQKLDKLQIGEIATIGGRYYGMDRDNNYDRLKKGYDVIVRGGNVQSLSIEEYVKQNYDNNITDEFLPPAVFVENGTLDDNDGLIVFNFRKDRLREMLTAITNPDFKMMDVVHYSNIKVVTMFKVVESVKAPFAFNDMDLKNTLGEYIENCGGRQLRIAETEKYAHVTFFFDGGKEVDYPHEKKILIPSPKVATYDLKPEMSALEITSVLQKEMANYDLIVLNFANGDMVGHTGQLKATVRAIEVLDQCIGQIVKEADRLGITVIITADHGNCEEMIDANNDVLTAHTTNFVPFLIIKEGIKIIDGPGKLADIAPTVLTLMELPIPKEMNGKTLIE